MDVYIAELWERKWHPRIWFEMARTTYGVPSWCRSQTKLLDEIL